jgi:mRNA interferase RelE/StbE
MSPYRVYVTSEALAEIKDLPGNVRQRIRQAIRALADQPQPVQSKQLQFTLVDRQLFRIRLDNWRIVYAITESENAVDVLAVRKRPPYDYGDLAQLLEELGSE